MYINDPFEKTLAPKREIPIEEEDIKPRDYHEYFWDDQPMPGNNVVGLPQRLHTRVCRFDDEGNHISMSDKCPHFDESDEMGKQIRKGWTVQSDT